MSAAGRGVAESKERPSVEACYGITPSSFGASSSSTFDGATAERHVISQNPPQTRSLTLRVDRIHLPSYSLPQPKISSLLRRQPTRKSVPPLPHPRLAKVPRNPTSTRDRIPTSSSASPHRSTRIRRRPRSLEPSRRRRATGVRPAATFVADVGRRGPPVLAQRDSFPRRAFASL